MNFVTETQTAHPIAKVDRDLREIINLHATLLTEAIHSANAQIDNHSLPGGRAMVELGSIANLEAWTNQQGATERYERAYTSAEDEDPDEAWPVSQLIEFWSEQWRVEHDAEYGQRTNIHSEASFLRNCLEWAWDNEPRFDNFAADIRRARLNLEDIVYAGQRVDRTRVVCNKCDEPRRLIRLEALYDPTGDLITYKCPACKERFSEDDFQRAYADMLKSDGAKLHVPLVEAIATLKAQGRGVRTVRRWLSPLQAKDRCTECDETWVAGEFNVCPSVNSDGEECGGFFVDDWAGDRDAILGRGYCEVGTHRVMVYWPDLWTKHLETRQARLIA